MKKGKNFNNKLDPKLLNVCVWGVGNQDRVLKHCHVLKQNSPSSKANLEICQFWEMVVKVQSNSRPDPIRNELLCNVRQQRFNDAELFL